MLNFTVHVSIKQEMTLLLKAFDLYFISKKNPQSAKLVLELCIIKAQVNLTTCHIHSPIYSFL